jgi:cytochrome c556
MNDLATRNVFAALLLAFSLAAAAAAAASEPEDIIKYRKNVMKSNGAHMAAAAGIVQGKLPEYKKRLTDHAQAIVTFTRDIPALFPKDSDFGDTDALNTVWSKRADFEKRAKDTEKAAAAFAAAVKAGNDQAITARFKELSDSCKACHKDFRREQN